MCSDSFSHPDLSFQDYAALGLKNRKLGLRTDPKSHTLLIDLPNVVALCWHSGKRRNQTELDRGKGIEEPSTIVHARLRKSRMTEGNCFIKA